MTSVGYICQWSSSRVEMLLRHLSLNILNMKNIIQKYTTLGVEPKHLKHEEYNPEIP